MKKECIAMLLAGGQGSRLYVLTGAMAKPAVPFGGKFRIIDFPLSNCTNSGIDTVGVLTQYRPMELNSYIGSGQPWDLDSSSGGVHILPPYMGSKGGTWYKGTANAIYQNIDFIERYDPEYVLVLSGDHIYKMDYSRMLAAHKANNADCTIAVLDVPKEEASRFGILNTREDDSIYEFDEKPAHPKSTLASMGIYIFSWKKLRQYLIADEDDPHSQNDFGKNVLPAMLEGGERMFAYRFEGYWKDVGTIESLWEANLDLLNPHVPLDLADPTWKIYSRTPGMPPHYLAATAQVQNSILAEGCSVSGKVEYSVIFSGVTVEEGAEIVDSILMPGTVVRKGARVQYAILAENTEIGENARVGESPEECADLTHWGVAVVAAGIRVGAGATVEAKAMVENDIPENGEVSVHA